MGIIVSLLGGSDLVQKLGILNGVNDKFMSDLLRRNLFYIELKMWLFPFLS